MFEANALWLPVIGRAPIPFGQRVQKAGGYLPTYLRRVGALFWRQ
ncbi:protein of unknown function [Shewanella benthica]|uniref:Uncharacterized protein n=1 Tax=Shewanella benthica TaxID=43661 RepID=A0A330M702_9GAMM|nr:protein of unknown function [Shewanella benthica]